MDSLGSLELTSHILSVASVHGILHHAFLGGKRKQECFNIQSCNVYGALDARLISPHAVSAS